VCCGGKIHVIIAKAGIYVDDNVTMCCCYIGMSVIASHIDMTLVSSQKVIV
jgi:hypothetical protein